MMEAQTSYTPVYARQHFGRASGGPLDPNMARAAQPPPQPQAGRRDWSPSVRQYVQRAFAENNAVSGVSRSDMEAKLKEIISGAATSNSLESIDWNNFPLPQQIIFEERKAAINAPISNPPMQVTNSLSTHSPSKKRKSSEFARDNDHLNSNESQANLPPWRTQHTLTKAEKRTVSQEKRFRLDGNIASYNTDASLENRKRRFESRDSGNNSPRPSRFVQEDSPMSGADDGPVVGRSTTLEKKYFRLTSAPNPDDVRPLHILEQTLELLKKKWKKEGNYAYICDQFKSLRQDLTVQHIKTEFTVTVYEIHARIALEKGDLGEYNQCQTQLSALYAQKLGGHPMEFKAYRILYFMYTCDRSGMNSIFATLTQAEKTSPEVKHALDARSALAAGNYRKFFKLYHETPNMGAYLMDMFVQRERLVSFCTITKAYKPDVPLRVVTDSLGFESDEEAARFICDYNGQDFLQEKDSTVRLITDKHSFALFENARKAAFAKIDIKGQI